MACGAMKNKTLEQKRFFRARVTFRESVMVADGALKLDYVSVIFVDPGVQIDETELDSLTTVAAYHMHGLWYRTSQQDYG